MVCRKFHFQCFNYVDDRGKGTLSAGDAVECTPATAFVVSDHLGQLLVTDAMPREGMFISSLPAVWHGSSTAITAAEHRAEHASLHRNAYGS